MKQVLGYFLGFAIFIVGIPALMWLVSGMPAPADISVGRLYLSAIIATAGLSLSVWSIVYMKRLASPISFAIMLLYIPLIAKRIRNEEKVLEEGLAEYKETKPVLRTR